MIDHNTRRVLLSFIIIVFLMFGSCSRKVTSGSFERATVMIFLTIIFIIIKSIILVYCLFLVVLVLGKEFIVTVAGDNILDDL
jgi:hypothetical protein